MNPGGGFCVRACGRADCAAIAGAIDRGHLCDPLLYTTFHIDTTCPSFHMPLWLAKHCACRVSYEQFAEIPNPSAFQRVLRHDVRYSHGANGRDDSRRCCTTEEEKKEDWCWWCAGRLLCLSQASCAV